MADVPVDIYTGVLNSLILIGTLWKPLENGEYFEFTGKKILQWGIKSNTLQIMIIVQCYQIKKLRASWGNILNISALKGKITDKYSQS